MPSAAVAWSTSSLRGPFGRSVAKTEVVKECRTVETIEKYERRVEGIEAERERRSTMERFERRIAEIESQIKPQLDELRALKAGLKRLRQGAEGDPAVKSAVSSNRPHANMASATAGQTASARRRR